VCRISVEHQIPIPLDFFMSGEVTSRGEVKQVRDHKKKLGAMVPYGSVQRPTKVMVPGENSLDGDSGTLAEVVSHPTARGPVERFEAVTLRKDHASRLQLFSVNNIEQAVSYLFLGGRLLC
jgi:hypothetical protein